MDEEAIFRGLNDAHRRRLLDALFERDGQTLGELCELFPEMSRFGVMKHLGVLEEAGLISTRRHGRSKLHFLNPVPIVWIHDRWISKYAEPWARGLGRLKFALEGNAMERPKHVYKTFIRTTPERLWSAITDPDQTEQYFFGVRVTSNWTVGSELRYLVSGGQTGTIGEIVVCDPPKKLVHTFSNIKDGREVDLPSRVTYEIEQNGDHCLLTVMHDEFAGETETYKEVGGGWPWVLSSLKSLLETGQALEQSA